jgi:hypothetical protein
MSAYERLVYRRRAVLRLEVIFLLAISIIATATAQIVF